jgi:hypothetical protein
MRKVRDWAGVGALGSGIMIANAGPTTVAALAYVGATAATGGAAALVVGAALLAPTVFRVILPRSRKKHHNLEITKKDLEYLFWDCHIFNIGIIGPAGTGKTTIKQLIRGLSTANLKTTGGKEYHLVKLSPSSTKFGALIDGKGAVDVFGDQLNTALESNILIVVLDHFNTRDEKKPTAMNCDPMRLEFHKRFSQDVFRSLSDIPPKVRRHVIFLITKKDLWMKGTDLPRWSNGSRRSKPTSRSTIPANFWNRYSSDHSPRTITGMLLGWWTSFRAPSIDYEVCQIEPCPRSQHREVTYDEDVIAPN